MLLYQLFTNIYVVDYFVFEDFVTSTWDIIAEKFGYMLVWGDLVFIPFTFTLQAWFLINDRTYYSPVEIAGLVILFLSGYVIFRFANMQKHDFKKNPKALVWGRKPEILGERCKYSKLNYHVNNWCIVLVSGWWGLASHINYLGDLILAVSYAAPCGLLRHASFIPWFYPIYLFTLLIHRDWRDDKKCSEKYGKLWQQYRKRVPYRILPYVY
jgi:delta14-sterol reductase